MPVTLEPLAEAIAHHSAKTPVGSILRTRQWAQMPLALRVRGQFSAGVESARILHRVQDGILRILDHSRTPDGVFESRARLRRDLMSLAREEGLTGPGPDSGRITDIGSAARTDLIVRTQTQQAYGHAEWKSGQDPDALDAAPAWELFRLQDRERPRDWMRRWREAGGRFHGSERMIALKTDPIWARLSRFGTPWPPFDFNSGMWVSDVSRAEAEELGVLPVGQEVQPVEADFNRDMEASVRGIGPELRQNLQNLFGPQIQVDGDRVRWKPAGRDYEQAAATARTRSRSFFTRSEADQRADRLGHLHPPESQAALRFALEEARVEIAAVAAGRKPLFHEQLAMAGGQAALARLARDWQRLLPAGIRIKADGDHLYAWNPALVGRLATPGRPLWDQVREHAENGRWLGYGIHMFEPGAKSRVTIHAPDGRLVAGFVAPRAHRHLYAAARARDWTEATGILHTYEIQSL